MSSSKHSTPIWYAAPIDEHGQPMTAGIPGRTNAGHAVRMWAPYCGRLFVSIDTAGLTIYTNGETSSPAGAVLAAFEPEAIMAAIRAAAAVAAEQPGWDIVAERFDAAVEAGDFSSAAGFINRVTRAAGIDPIGDALLAQLVGPEPAAESEEYDVTTHYTASDGDARQYIGGDFGTLTERLEAAGVSIDWADAWPLVQPDGEITGVTTSDDGEKFVVLDREHGRWVPGSTAAMRLWDVAEAVRDGLMTTESARVALIEAGLDDEAAALVPGEQRLAGRIDRDQLAERMAHLMDGYVGGEAWSLYVDPVTAELSVDRALDLVRLSRERGLASVITDADLAEYCRAGIPATAAEWREIVEDFVGDTGIFDQIEEQLAEEAGQAAQED